MKEVLSVGFPTDDKRLTSGAFSISRSLAKGLAQDDRVLSVTPASNRSPFRRLSPIKPYLSRMGHDHSVPQSSHPRRRHPGFQSNPATRYPAADLLHCLRACCQFLFQKYFSRSFQNVVSDRSIQAHSQSLPLNFFDRTCRCGGNLLHCRSPLSSMTWSVSHSAGDRSSHPVCTTTMSPRDEVALYSHGCR